MRVTQPFSPAHDLMGEQHSAHFRVLVLTLIDDGLGREEEHRLERKEAPLLSKRSRERGMAPPPGKIIPSKSLWGPKIAKQELGAWLLPHPGSPLG